MRRQEAPSRTEAVATGSSVSELGHTPAITSAASAACLTLLEWTVLESEWTVLLEWTVLESEWTVLESGLADSSPVGMLGVWYQSVIFGATKSPAH